MHIPDQCCWNRYHKLSLHPGKKGDIVSRCFNISGKSFSEPKKQDSHLQKLASPEHLHIHYQQNKPLPQ